MGKPWLVVVQIIRLRFGEHGKREQGAGGDKEYEICINVPKTAIDWSSSVAIMPLNKI
jgi:hypothetical protein